MRLDIGGRYASERQQRAEELRRKQLAANALAHSDLLFKMRNEEAEKKINCFLSKLVIDALRRM